MQRRADFSAGRRSLLRGVAGAFGAAAIAAPFSRRTFAAGGLIVERVTDNVNVIGGAGGNIVVYSTGPSQIVVDSGAAGYEQAVHATLGELPGERVAALINTHWHLDQIGGNESFGSAGAEIFAHDKTRQRLTTGYYLHDEERYRAPVPAAARPTNTFHAGGTTTIDGRRIEYGHMLAAHTDGDCYVRFADENVIAVGDVLAPERDPAFDWFGGGWLGGRVDALAALLESTDAGTRFVPSYGPVVGRAEVEAEHALMLAFFELMVEHVRLGESAEDMLELGILDALPRKFDDPYRLLYDTHKGFWANYNKLMHDIV